MVALRLEHKPGWHTYWKTPGIGEATTVSWQLPVGFDAQEIQWPAPELIETGGRPTGNGFTGDVLLPVSVTAPTGLTPGGSASLIAKVQWLMCSEERCIPGSADRSLDLPISEVAEADPVWGAKIARVLAELPRELPAWSVRASSDGSLIRLMIGPVGAPAMRSPEHLRFFSTDGYVSYDGAQDLVSLPDGYRLTLHVSDEAPSPAPDRLEGVLTSENGWSGDGSLRGLKIDVPLRSGATNEPATPTIVDKGDGVGLLVVMGFVGGLILNLMPCVFPVLGVKLLSFANHAGSDRRAVRAHGLSYVGGVLVSFWALFLVLLAVKAGGRQIGWGFQLQSPAVVFSLAVVTLVFGLNLSGVFQLGHRAMGVGSRLQLLQGYAGSFFTGVFATVVATPCSAPILAPALGAALVVPTQSSFFVLTAIALGFSLPYVLLSIFPKVVGKLPRPGRWMETLKHLMAFPLYATTAFLTWVLAGQLTERGLLAALLGLTVVAMGTWLYGRYGAPTESDARVRFGVVGGAALLLLGTLIGWPRLQQSSDVVWEPWSKERVEALRADGRTIYIDFTARWCATCQANKEIVFGSEEVRRYFRTQDVAALKADWTNGDSRIAAELATWHRSAVPFNLLYRAGEGEPEVLPEILTPRIVLNALRRGPYGEQQSPVGDTQKGSRGP